MNLQLIIDYLIVNGWSIQIQFDRKGIEANLYHESYRGISYIPLPQFKCSNIDELVNELMTSFKLEFTS
jgi:hypothetical protein